MAIKVDYHKGQEPYDIQREYENLIGKKWFKFSKDDQSNFKIWMKEKGYFHESGKFDIHKNNWKEKFMEFQWVTIVTNEKFNKATIKEFSDYPIQYRCGRLCLTYLTTDVLALVVDMDKYFEKREHDADPLPTYKCSYGMDLYDWEIRAIYAMMKNLDNIKEENT
jgi:hypothetical protein